MNRHLPSHEEEEQNRPSYKENPPITFGIIVALAVGFAIMLFLSAGCKSVPSQAPKASTAAVGVNLYGLGQSLGQAQDSVNGVRSNLSEVDAKAVRIKEAIRNW